MSNFARPHEPAHEYYDHHDDYYEDYHDSHRHNGRHYSSDNPTKIVEDGDYEDIETEAYTRAKGKRSSKRKHGGEVLQGDDIDAQYGDVDSGEVKRGGGNTGGSIFDDPKHFSFDFKDMDKYMKGMKKKQSKGSKNGRSGRHSKKNRHRNGIENDLPVGDEHFMF